jgi:hypothetical protein
LHLDVEGTLRNPRWMRPNPSGEHFALTLGRALADLARDVSGALSHFASSLDALPTGTDPLSGLPSSHRAILELPDLAGPEGLSADQIADRLDYTVPAATSALHGLADLDLLEQVPGETQARWRRPPQTRQ